MSTSMQSSKSEIATFETVRPYSEADDPCFAELAAVLEKHNALNRFGIFLLHEHFPVGDDEVLVESVEAADRTMVTRPMKNSNAGGIVLETMWQLGPNPIEAAGKDPKGGRDMSGTPPRPRPRPQRKCIQSCVWDDGPNGRHHHKHHKPDDSGS